jgi:hypothetical protein
MPKIEMFAIISFVSMNLVYLPLSSVKSTLPLNAERLVFKELTSLLAIASKISFCCTSDMIFCDGFVVKIKV